MSELLTRLRRRQWAFLTALMAVAVAGAIIVVKVVDASDGIPTGSALDAEGEGGILQPLPPETAVSVGTVVTRNLSSEPVQLVEARFLRIDPDVRLLGFSALRDAPNDKGDLPPITALVHPLPDAIPLEEFSPPAS